MTQRLRLLVFSLASTLLLACAASTPGAVQSGSMARFIAHGGFLYALDGHELRVYETVPGASPEHRKTIELYVNAETLYPYENMLFVGSRQGMLVYSLSDPASPELTGKALHALSCDPVVVEDGVAYVTLRSAGCRQGIDALLVFDVKDPKNPKGLAHHPLASPHGLDIDEGTLFIADKKDGLLVFDVREPLQPRLLTRVSDIAGYDVIARAGLLFVSADDGIHQYRYGPEGINERLSRIPIARRARAPLTLAY